MLTVELNMRVKLNHILITLFLAVLTPAGVHYIQAQDASYPLPDSYDIEAEKEREKIIYSPGETEALLNSKVHVAATRDSASSKQNATRVIRNQAETPKNSAKPSSQEDDSILSFNFLYYLFEKYKMQDIVD